MAIKLSKFRKLGLLAALGGGLLLTACHKPCVTEVQEPLSLKELQEEYKAVLEENGVQIIELGETITIAIPTDLLFELDTTHLLPGAEDLLDRVADLMRTYDKGTIKVAGYSDCAGSDLTTRQAHTVYRDLDYKNINARLIYAVGYGSKNKIALSDTPLSAAKNRRIEISFRFYPHEACDD